MSSDELVNGTADDPMSSTLDLSEPCSPSPLTPLHNPSSLHNVNARRPPRKSTLTQQQKNQKRQRATQDQLTTLEVEFNKNPTPTAVVRERIAQDINMTERSVQIWFQNRRAKIKNLAKRSIETGEDCDAIPDSMRKYLAMQALESGKPLHDVRNAGFGNLGNGLIMNTENQAKVLIQHLQCRSLSIGTWRRMSQTALDLVVFYSPAKSMFTYYINADSSGFKIEYPFSSIKNVTLDNGDASAGAEGASQRPGGLIIELSQAPSFSMDPGSGGFFQCRDFTEDQQASKILVHHLGGHSKILSGQLAKLVGLDTFRNRHLIPEQNNLTVSAPVSPVGFPRPASQPNQLLHPHTNGMQPHPSVEMPPPPSRIGHKRQRSRSVPAAVDYSQLRRPLPPFVQAEVPTSMHHQYPQHHQIHAPFPQHAPFTSVPPLQNGFAPVGSNLSINTVAAGYDFDFRSAPMSATTVNSSEFEASMFTTGPQSEAYTANVQTPYSGPFLSPMVNPSNLNNPPVSPFSTVSHPDPIIANQSPPLNSFDRRASADVYHGSQDHPGFQEGTFNFNELYGKQQPFQLPFRQSNADTPPEPEFDFHNMIHFSAENSVSLSPDQSRVSSSNA